MPELLTCKSYGNTFTGKFCNECGEKVYRDHDKSMRHFFEESFHFLTHVDGKFLKSIRLLFTNPGFISSEITSGIRKKIF